MERLVVTPREAAKMLFASLDTVNAKCHSGEIPAYRDGRNWKIPIAGLEEYVVDKAKEEAMERREKRHEAT